MFGCCYDLRFVVGWIDFWFIVAFVGLFSAYTCFNSNVSLFMSFSFVVYYYILIVCGSIVVSLFDWCLLLRVSAIVCEMIVCFWFDGCH